MTSTILDSRRGNVNADRGPPPPRSRPGADRAVVIGAGVAGLSAALGLAARGWAVTVVERAAGPGGKMRALAVDGRAIDAGPTVLTMADVFEAIFAEAGAALADRLALRPAAVLARHAWPDGSALDLYADLDRSADAIAAFAGPAEAAAYRRFAAEAAAVRRLLEPTFMRAGRPSPVGLARRVGVRDLRRLAAIRPFASLWRVLGERFRDPRLRQLFARYATYCGASPFRAPATLMLVAEVERAGVWLVEGGMHRLAEAMAALAAERGVAFAYGAGCEEILVASGRAAGVRLDDGRHLPAEAVVATADWAAVAGGLLGAGAACAVPAPRDPRSLSAVTWVLRATARGFPLARHTVFFSGDYAAEFAALESGRRPDDPTVYVCAQDRSDDGIGPAGTPERLLCLVNAPATGDSPNVQAEDQRCEDRTFRRLEAGGLILERRAETTRRTGPAEWAALYPGTGGALYGRAVHGWRAAFRRPGARTALPGLYLAGGSAHPGPGVPMAALSGSMAARSATNDRDSTIRSRRVAMPGGTSTR